MARSCGFLREMGETRKGLSDLMLTAGLRRDVAFDGASSMNLAAALGVI